MEERVEQKFFVAPGGMVHALALVRRVCRWDGQYPQEQINSLYFDTPDLEQHQRSLAGEFAKAKIRIRWYGERHDAHRPPEGAAGRSAGDSDRETVPVWLELKQRRGFASNKQRAAVTVKATALELRGLTGGIVSTTDLMHAMAGFGFFSPKRLCPVIAVSYWRRRFVEPTTGFRVALDSRIRSTVFMPGLSRGEPGLELPGAVIEVKGPTAELPACLRELAASGSSWTRFSKYSSSLDAHMGDLGSVSRLWPSGSMNTTDRAGV